MKPCFIIKSVMASRVLRQVVDSQMPLPRRVEEIQLASNLVVVRLLGSYVLVGQIKRLVPQFSSPCTRQSPHMSRLFQFLVKYAFCSQGNALLVKTWILIMVLGRQGLQLQSTIRVFDIISSVMVLMDIEVLTYSYETPIHFHPQF